MAILEHSKRRMQPSMRMFVLSSPWLSLFFVIIASAAALGRVDNIIDLTDKTFDSINDAFGHKPMLILAQEGHHKNNKAMESFRKLSKDQILRENGIMLATIDTKDNRMLRARMNIKTADSPTLFYLSNDRLYRYQGDLSSASHMRSYALKGYENNSAEKIMGASMWLYLNTICVEFLYYNNEGRLNLFVLLLSSAVVGMLAMFAFAMIVVSISSEEGDKKKKTT